MSFVALLVFTRDRQDIITLTHSWTVDNTKPVDDVLASHALPKTAVLVDFCFARKARLDVIPSPRPCLTFVFTLTTSTSVDGPQRAYGFCLRAQRPGFPRYDVGGDVVDTLCFVTREPCYRLFVPALQILRVRRILDPQSGDVFLAALHKALVNNKPGGNAQAITVETSFGGVATNYVLSLSRQPPLEGLFDDTTIEVLQYVLGAILLERRIVLIASTELVLSRCTHALLSLLVDLCNYPHVLIPILPAAMMEHGVSSPTPYLVGVLRTHVRVLDSLKELGDVVFVDLDKRNIRVSKGGQPIIPLGASTGMDSALQPNAGGGGGGGAGGGATAASGGGDVNNPWMDVCVPFAKDLATAFASRDGDVLLASIRAIILIITYGRAGMHLEDPAVRFFHAQFRKTQYFASSVTPKTTESIGGILTSIRGGYIALRQTLASQTAHVSTSNRARANDTKTMVDGLINKTLRPEQIKMETDELAKRSFDSAVYEPSDVMLQAKLRDSQGRNWKNAYKVLGLLDMTVRAGSELCVASCWDSLSAIFALTRFSLAGVVGIPQRTEGLVRKRAEGIYSLLVNVPLLCWARSVEGHPMLRRHEQVQVMKNIRRLHVGSLDLKALLEQTGVGKLTKSQPSSPPPRQVLSVENNNPVEVVGGDNTNNPFDAIVGGDVVIAPPPQSPPTVQTPPTVPSKPPRPRPPVPPVPSRNVTPPSPPRPTPSPSSSGNSGGASGAPPGIQARSRLPQQ